MNEFDIVVTEYNKTIVFLNARLANLAMENAALRTALELKAKAEQQVHHKTEQSASNG